MASDATRGVQPATCRADSQRRAHAELTKRFRIYGTLATACELSIDDNCRYALHTVFFRLGLHGAIRAHVEYAHVATVVWVPGTLALDFRIFWPLRGAGSGDGARHA